MNLALPWSSSRSPRPSSPSAASLPPRLVAWLDERFLDKLLASARGRAFMLGFMAYAEEADELGVFDQLLARVDDPALGKLVRRHRDDEERHASLFRACLARTGAPALPVPEELRYVDRLDRHLGDFGAAFVAGRLGVMEAYLLLQVIEERGVERFAQIARAFRRVDPETADVIDAVVADEGRHVRYAHAISKRYAPDEATLTRTLARYRAAEERAFFEHGAALLRFAVRNDLLEASRAERAAWRLIATSSST
jgi:rubrerythrin